jgi:uncharacterized protein YbaR (Trm112 family)
MASRKQVVADLDNAFKTKYICHCDPSIPLHQLVIMEAKLMIYRMRFWCYHPCHELAGRRQLTLSEEDEVFEYSIRLLQLKPGLREMKFSKHLLWHLNLARTEGEALVYMTSELRRRTTGTLVCEAWTVLERIHDECPSLLQDSGKFYTAFRDLVLSAWEARRASAEMRDASTPKFVESIQIMKRTAEARGSYVDSMEQLVPDEDFSLGWIHDEQDWVEWDDFLQL